MGDKKETLSGLEKKIQTQLKNIEKAKKLIDEYTKQKEALLEAELLKEIKSSKKYTVENVYKMIIDEKPKKKKAKPKPEEEAAAPEE